MAKPSLSLIVLRTAEISKSLVFYRTIGLEFIEEQHGKGPVHYVCEMGSMVIEIFPGQPGTAPDRKNAGATMLGFRVERLDDILETLRTARSVIITEPQTSTWGYRAVVQDPDGRAVELTQPIIKNDL